MAYANYGKNINNIKTENMDVMKSYPDTSYSQIPNYNNYGYGENMGEEMDSGEKMEPKSMEFSSVENKMSNENDKILMDIRLRSNEMPESWKQNDDGMFRNSNSNENMSNNPVSNDFTGIDAIE